MCVIIHKYYKERGTNLVEMIRLVLFIFPLYYTFLQFRQNMFLINMSSVMFKKRLLSKECILLLKNKGYNIVELKDILNQVEFKNPGLKNRLNFFRSETFGYKNLNELNKIKFRVFVLSRVSKTENPYDQTVYPLISWILDDDLNINNLVRSLLKEIINENI